MGFSLEDEGHNWKYIYSGNNKIGRVCQHADGSYIGLVGKSIMVKGCRTEKEAFNEAVAQHLRYDNPHKNKKKRHHKQSAPIMHRMTPIMLPQERFTATKAFMRPRMAA